MTYASSRPRLSLIVTVKNVPPNSCLIINIIGIEKNTLKIINIFLIRIKIKKEIRKVIVLH